jgi:septum site-determining protein MinC
MKEPIEGSREPEVEVRFGPVGLAQVRLRTTHPQVVHADLAGRVATAPKMFERMPVALDLNELDRVPSADEMGPVIDAVRRAGLLPIGFARGSEALDALARALDMPVLMQFRSPKKSAAEPRGDERDAVDATEPMPAGGPAADVRAPAPRPVGAAPPVPTAGVPMTPGAAAAARRAGLNRPPSERAAPAPPPPPEPAARAREPEPRPDAGDGSPALIHSQPVRSGQRLYARNRDLVVTATVGAGAEVMADGCVHVYGALRGRAMAGTRGDLHARVFCQDFNAELVSIAGVFRVFETIPPELAGKPVQAWLDGDALRFAAIG